VSEQEVKIYLTEREIGDHLYGEPICARSREEAEESAARLGTLRLPLASRSRKDWRTLRFWPGG
jgi:hypothetical protein